MIAATEQIHDYCTENPPEAMYLYLVCGFVDLWICGFVYDFIDLFFSYRSVSS